MVRGKDFFKEFIEQLEELDESKDYDAENVDGALAKWIKTYYPNGFVIDLNRRDLMVKMIKKAAEMNNLVLASKLRPYLDAIIAMKWRQLCEDELAKSRKLGHELKAIDYRILIKFAEEILILGYSLRIELEKINKKESDKNAKGS